MARSHENHLARARARLNEVHEQVDKLETQLQELRKQTVEAEVQLSSVTREYVEARTAEAIAKLNERKE